MNELTEGSLAWFKHHVADMEARRDLPFCESYIRKAAYGAILMGQALKFIRQEKLFRPKFKTIEAYAETVWNIKPWQFRHKIRASDCALLLLEKSGDQITVLPEMCWGMLSRLEEDEAQDALAEIQTEIANGASASAATKKVFLKRKRATKKRQTQDESNGDEKMPEIDSGASGGHSGEVIELATIEAFRQEVEEWWEGRNIDGNWRDKYNHAGFKEEEMIDAAIGVLQDRRNAALTGP